MGDANGSIPTVQPVIGRPMWGYHPSAAALNSVVWVSQASVDIGAYISHIALTSRQDCRIWTEEEGRTRQELSENH